MNLLAFDTSTERLSAAVQRGDARWRYDGAGGARASETLIPALLDLLAQAGLALTDLDALVFGRGPGSFTGLRTACAVAQGLAFGAALPVLPVDTLLAVAEDARLKGALHGAARVLALLDARMNEVYAAAYAWTGGAWQAVGDMTVGAPEALALPDGSPHPVDWVLAGNIFGPSVDYGARLSPPLHTLPRIDAMPTADALLALAPARLAQGLAVAAQDALPLYIRDKVALTTAERSARASGTVMPAAPTAGISAAAARAAESAAPPAVRLEPMTPVQLPAVLAAERTSHSHPWTQGNFLDSLRTGWQAQCLMADDALLGYFIAMSGVNEAHLLNLTVAPAYRGQGWSRMLLDALALWARGQGAASLWLEVRSSNVHALRVYERYGFVRIGTRKDYYPTKHGTREDAVVMNCQL